MQKRWLLQELVCAGNCKAGRDDGGNAPTSISKYFIVAGAPGNSCNWSSPGASVLSSETLLQLHVTKSNFHLGADIFQVWSLFPNKNSLVYLFLSKNTLAISENGKHQMGKHTLVMILKAFLLLIFKLLLQFLAWMKGQKSS